MGFGILRILQELWEILEHSDFPNLRVWGLGFLVGATANELLDQVHHAARVAPLVVLGFRAFGLRYELKALNPKPRMWSLLGTRAGIFIRIQGV